LSINTIEEISPVVLLYLDEGNDGSVKLSTIMPPLKKEKKSVITTTVQYVNRGEILTKLEVLPGNERGADPNDFLLRSHG
jgi:spore germination protein